MRKILVVLAAAFATAAIAVTPAFAGTETWTPGQGTYGECAGTATPGLHWIFTGESSTAPVLTVVDANGTETITMAQQGQGGGAWHGFSDGDAEPISASVSYTGEDSNAVLTISDGCFGSSTTTTTGGPTTDTGGPTTDTGGPTTDTGGPTTTTGGPTTTGSGGISGGTTGGTGGTTGGTASTGGELPFTGLPVWIPLLAAAALLVSGIFLVRRKKGELA
jgi:hypothetical protein